MGVVTYEMEVATTIPPANIFKAFVLDSDNLIPKILPLAIKSVVTLEGDGGAGIIKQVNFGEDYFWFVFPAGNQFTYMKQRIDGIDKENFSYRYTVIEGDALMGALEKISNENKFEAAYDGGSMCKSSCSYYTIGDIDIKEEEIKAGKEKASVMFKAIEAYLLANPDAYN
ncbi:major allergen Pru ar 1-like [Herrania umbratica]|uniref:Major allergen Pru ar 1-like n=1 Tax=Herrania umbratica TaxID=108875 RepID=A0A6J1AYM8_9ROSI|nr:major allergen Pru ar 1-like [Herrania umbratica]